MDRYEEGFEEEAEEIVHKKTGNGWLKFSLFILVCILGIGIGLALGFYLGILSLMTIIEDVAENTTIVFDLDEERIVEYMITLAEERYGDLAKMAILGEGLNNNMTDEEKLLFLVDNIEIDELEQFIELDDETKELLEELKTHPEQRDISQTQQNYVPPELETEARGMNQSEIDRIRKEMEAKYA